jgi:CCR4-NOT transcription complex subunit 2
MGFNGTQPSAYAGAAGTGYRQRNAFPEQSLSNMAPELGFNPSEAVNAPGPSPSRGRQSTALGNRKRLSDMTPRERDGLLGLAARLDPEHPDFSQLAIGHDLTQLGLELARPECVRLPLSGAG